MLYVPPISDYKPFYVQFASGNAQDILTQYSVVVKAHDYPMAYKVKEPYKNQWKDENGDDEYIPSAGLKLEAFTFKLECAMFARPTAASQGVAAQTANEVLSAGVRAFKNALIAGAFKTYDAYTAFGFKEVRLQEFQMPSQDAYVVWDSKNGSSTDYVARVIFTVILKVNDPTNMVLSGSGPYTITEG